MNSLSLSDSVTPILGLLVHSRVPVCVKKDNTVRSCKIDAYSTASRATYETEKLRREIKSIDHFLSRLNFY